MLFSDKLNFLMNITHAANKELAMEISVDRSLISLLRSGKRGTPRNQNHIQGMALFFAQRVTADFQRHALADMLNQTVLRSPMPSEMLANYLYKWLCGDADLVDEIIEALETTPPRSPHALEEPPLPLPSGKTTFYYDGEGRREAMRSMMDMIRSIDTPCSVLVASDANLEWLLSDYLFANEMQTNLLELLDKGFTFHQIMPSMNYLNSYVESLRYWLPAYVTERTKVYYYPRLRDNLYRHSTIILPDHCVQTVTGIGLGNHNHIALVSTDPALVQAYTSQYREYLSLCRPALITHNDPNEFIPCLTELLSRQGTVLQRVSPLPATTLPRELLEQCIRQTDVEGWRATYQIYLDAVPRFEERLTRIRYIDIVRLATADEVRAGTVPIGSPYPTTPGQPCYTPETYVLHLKNILRLMETYDNYLFIPAHDEKQFDYNLVVNEDGLALLYRNSPPSFMLEIRRPAIVAACREHLYRIAEHTGFDGIQQAKVRSQINALIRELQD